MLTLILDLNDRYSFTFVFLVFLLGANDINGDARECVWDRLKITSPPLALLSLEFSGGYINQHKKALGHLNQRSHQGHLFL